ncbi:MAG: mechanosensitive ion channel [Candidatus Bathyarchaeota archaeon]|nr:mechanosensitive ion channel [Candidatus Bathyarchaeota archaeon]
MDAVPPPKHRHVDYGRSLLKILILFVLLSACLTAVEILFQWTDVDQLPGFLQPYSAFLLFASPYLRYFNAAIILVLGYFIVGEVGNIVYAYMRGFADHSSAATVQNVARIVGFGVLVAVLASVFSVDPAAALTLGSFGGLVVGFATQTFLANTIAGLFVLITRPFTFGDVVTMSGNTGTVKEIKLMHLIMEAEDGSKDILIPNSLVLSQIILKRRPGIRMGPTATTVTLEQPPTNVKVGEKLTFKGRLTQTATGKPLADASVHLYDRDIGKDDLLVEGITDAEGKYSLEWVAKKVDFLDDAAEIYVKFMGDDEHRSSNTKQFVIEVRK